MDIFITLVRQEWRSLWRGRTFQLLMLVTGLLTVYAIGTGTLHSQQAAHDHEHLADTARHLLENQKSASAHMAGHYGHVVFKPATFLREMDPGVDAFVGTTVKLEAHRQQQAVFAEASGRSTLIRFGQFSYALILQVVVPLLILFTGYRAVQADRANGTLKLLLCQGITMRRIILARITAQAAIYWALLSMGIFAYGIIQYFGHPDGETTDGARLLLFWSVYLLYYLLLAALTVYLSARTASASGLLASLLSIWFVCTVIVPKSSASIGDHLYPLPTHETFWAGIEERKQQGINGHDRSNPYTKKFVDSILNAHGARDENELPFRLYGVLMQADEAFNNQLYDEAMGSVDSIIARQDRVGTWLSLVNPFLAVRNLSMVAAGTDMHHHFHFMREAENYRRELVSLLNEQDMLRESQYKDGQGKLKSSFWRQVETYRYRAPEVGWALSYRRIELASLLLWVTILLLTIYFTSERIKVS